MLHSKAKPSDYSAFCVTVYSASQTLLDFDEYTEYYGDLLRLLFWNPDVDNQIALRQQEQQKG